MSSPSLLLEQAASGLAPRPAARLPARVVRALQAERERGEILTSWVQAGLLCVFATLYFVAPSTSPLHVAMRPVPWALAFYAAFTAFRLYLVYAGRLGPAVRALLASEIGTRAAEGHFGPVNRWFAGTRHIDEVEALPSDEDHVRFHHSLVVQVDGDGAYEYVAQVVASSHKWEKPESHTLRFEVPVKKESAEKVTYRVRLRF